MTEAALSARPSLGLTLRSLLTADLAVLLRSRQTFIFNLAVPIVILLITNRGRLGDPAFLIGMAISYGLISSALMGYSLTVARDREAGVFQRLRVTPAPTWAIMTSRLAVQLLAAIVLTLVVEVVGSIIHRVAYSAGVYLLMLAVSLLGAAVFLSIGQALVGLVTSVPAVGAITRVLYILLVLTGILGPTGILGDDFRTFSDWTPVGALITLYTAAGDLGAWSWSDTGALLACAGYIVVFAFVGIRWFRWETG